MALRIAQWSHLTCSLVGLAYLLPDVAADVNGAALPQAEREDQLESRDQRRAAVGDAEQGRAEPTLLEIAEMNVPALEALGGAGAEAGEDLSAIGGDVMRAQDGLTLGVRVVLEEAGVGEEVVEFVVGEVTMLPELELVDEDLADPAHRRLRLRSLLAQRLGQGSLYIAHREPAHEAAMTSDSSAFVRVTPSPSRREAKGSGLPRSLGRSR
jgi:hypothetical protein